MSYQHTFSLDDVGKDIGVPMYSFSYAVSKKEIWKTAKVSVVMVVTSPTGIIALFRPKREFMSRGWNTYDRQAKAVRAFMEQ